MSFQSFASRLLKNPGIISLVAAAFFLFPGEIGSTDDKDRIHIPITNSGQHGVPDGWQLKEWKGKASFEVVDSEIGKTFRLSSNATSIALYRDIKFELRKYPVLNWRWKVTKLPERGDVRQKNADDQAAQIYVVFPRWPEAVNSRLVGYIWDTTAPEGAMVTSTKTSNVRYIVLKSGPSGMGRWFAERRNVYEDYKRLFNEDPPKAGRVSVMIDSDNTKSAAESFIGDIFFSKEAAPAL